MVVRIRVKSQSIKPKIDETVTQMKQRIERGAGEVAAEFAEVVVREGRADIAAAGNFSGKWVSGFTADVSGGAGVKTIIFRHSVGLWKVFQRGATISGKPLLWIPVDPGGPPASKFGGRLFSVKRSKKRDTPLLMSADDKQVKYIGVKRVRIRRRFHLLKIIRDEASKMRQRLREGMQKD